MMYHTLGSLVAPFAAKMQLTPDQTKSLEAIASSTEPTLILAYGGPDQIQLASAGSLFGLHVGQMLGLAHAGHR